MKIQITSDKPSKGQDSILGIVGQEHEAKIILEDGKPTGKVEIESKEFGGKIILNRGEFKVKK